VLAKILYASSAWSGLPQLLIGNESRHLSVAFIGLVSTGQVTLRTLTQRIADNDDNLFRKMLNNEHHILKQLLPDETNHQYHLRRRRHNLCLTAKSDERNFVIRQLFKDL